MWKEKRKETTLKCLLNRNKLKYKNPCNNVIYCRQFPLSARLFKTRSFEWIKQIKSWTEHGKNKKRKTMNTCQRKILYIFFIWIGRFIKIKYATKNSKSWLFDFNSRARCIMYRINVYMENNRKVLCCGNISVIWFRYISYVFRK